ncbi:hypothetical protein ACFLWZ_07385 [Chloroflexota bacterium]
MKHRLIGIAAVVVLVLTLLGSPVMAQPPVAQFSGSVALDGVAAPGSELEAMDGTAVVGTATATTGSQYFMLVPQVSGVPAEGATLNFYVDGYLGGSGTWNSGGITTKDLSAFAAPTYTLEVTISPSGSGSVSTSPDLTNYPDGTAVTLAASAGSGYDFSSWSGDASGSSSSTTVTMDSNQSVTANFVVEGTPVVQPDDLEGGLDDIVVTDSDIIFLAVAPDGTLFASVYDADDDDYTIKRSTDQGYTFKNTELEDQAEALVGIAISPDYEDDEIFYVLGEDATVWRMEDTGDANPKELRPIPGANNGYSIAAMYDGDDNFVAVGTEDDVFVIKDTYFSDWVDQNLNDAAIAVAFAPDFEDSELVWAVTDKGELIATIAPGKWGQVLGVADLTVSEAAPNLGTVEVAAIAFPDDYESEEGSILFVSVGDGADNGNIIMVDLVDAPDESFANACLSTDDDISSLAVSGDDSDAMIIAGNYEGVAKVYLSQNSGDSWKTLDKQPTGQGANMRGTSVAMAIGAFDEDEGVAYAGTAGTESAFSITKDGAFTWNQIELIDTVIAEILDLAFADSDNHFMVTQGATSSAWRTEDAGDSYERVYCSILDDTDAEFALVGLSEDDAEVVYLTGDDGTKSAVWKSDDNGQDFGDKRTVKDGAMIADWVITENDTIYAATDEGFYKTTNSGRTWDITSKPGDLNSIALSPDFDSDEMIIVGSTDGEVWMSDDEGDGFDDTDVGLTGIVFVAFDAEYADNDLIYAAGQDDPIQVGEVADTDDVDWDDLEDDLNDDVYTPDGCSGLAVSSDNVLYATDDSIGIVRLLLDEDDSVWESDDPLDIDDPKGLWITEGSNMLLSIEGIEIWDYDDELTGKVELNSPAKGDASTRLDRASMTWEELASDAKEYEIRVNTRDDFKGTDESPNDTTLTSATASGLQDGITYYWKVRVLAGEKLQSRWSDVWSFTTALGEGQWNPFKGGVSEAPDPGATGVSLTPTFAWNAADWTTTYDFVLAKDAAFSDTIVNKTVEGTTYLSESALDYSTTYYWKVRAEGASSYSEWATSVFTTMAEPEEPPPPVVVEENPPATIVIPPAPIVEIPATPAPITPAFIWAIIIIGAILVIAVIVLIIRTRRVS